VKKTIIGCRTTRVEALRLDFHGVPESGEKSVILGAEGGGVSRTGAGN
jgi:hypothetical protein